MPSTNSRRRLSFRIVSCKLRPVASRNYPSDTVPSKEPRARQDYPSSSQTSQSTRRYRSAALFGSKYVERLLPCSSSIKYIIVDPFDVFEPAMHHGTCNRAESRCGGLMPCVAAAVVPLPRKTMGVSHPNDVASWAKGSIESLDAMKWQVEDHLPRQVHLKERGLLPIAPLCRDPRTTGSNQLDRLWCFLDLVGLEKRSIAAPNPIAERDSRRCRINV